MPKPSSGISFSSSMSSSYLKDPSTLVPTLAASGQEDGVDAVVRFYANGTDEVKNLLKNECSIIYECSFCRSLFRSIINFTAHKRTICRSLQSTIRAEQLQLFKEQQDKNAAEKEEGTSTSKKGVKSCALRRFNPASNLSKHIRPLNVQLEKAKGKIELKTLPKFIRPTAKTTFVDGKQVVTELPVDMAIKNQIPKNRIPLIMPREHSRRYGIVQLRRRQSGHLTRKTGDESKTRELTPEEIAIVERIPSAIPVDFLALRCEDERCTKNQHFQHVAALAHHLAIQHQTDYVEEALLKKRSTPFIRCFLCDASPFKRLEDLQDHFNAQHQTVRAEHNKFRVEQLGADTSKRKDTTIYRVRSLSPRSDYQDEDGQKQNEENTTEKPAAPTNEAKTKKSPATDESAGKKKKTTGKGRGGKPTTMTIPELKFTQEEEREQQIEAAFALKRWIELTKPKQGNEEATENPIEDTQQVPFIDEEEARKIDKLLNSKAPEAESISNENTMEELSTNNTASMDAEDDEQEEMVPEGEEDSAAQPSLAMTRSPRPRRPNKRYGDYEDIRGAGEQAKSTRKPKPEKQEDVKQPIKKSPEKLPMPKEEIVPDKTENTDESQESSRKRKPSTSELVKNSKKMRKRKKMVGTLKRTTSSSEDNSIKTKQAIIPVPATIGLPKIQQIQDFVLPKSILGMEDKEKQDSEAVAVGTVSISTYENDTDGGTLAEVDHVDSSDMPGPSKILKEEVSTPPVLTKQKLPSMITDRYKEELLLYSPKARLLKEAGSYKRGFNSEPSRRKQNLNELPVEEGDQLSLLGTNTLTPPQTRQTNEAISADSNRPPPPPKPNDLSTVPVYLTEVQRDLFFKPLKMLFNEATHVEGLCQCGECGEVMKNIKDGRRHMVSHIRVIRLRCSLCDAGAFFSSDMRIHLMYRHCDKLNLAPEGFVNPAPANPCMEKEKADMLTKLVDPYSPGRIMYTTGKIVSWSNPKAYLPDPKIERNILGPVLPSYVASPTTSPRKIRSAILSPRKLPRQTPSSEQESKTTENIGEALPQLQSPITSSTTPASTSTSEWAIPPADHSYHPIEAQPKIYGEEMETNEQPQPSVDDPISMPILTKQNEYL